MVDITVCTPTYNRGNLLKRLYDSLNSQTRLPKEWIIVDDGSEDDTRKTVEELAIKSPFPIIYYYQINSGKHIAINTAVKYANGTLFFIVDSDDYLEKNGIEVFCKEWEAIRKLTDNARERIIGVAANRKYPDGKVIGGTPEYKFLDTDLLTFRYILNVKGDKAEAYRTEVVRNNLFPVIEGERFCPEALVFYRLAHEGYQLRFINESVYVCEYLEGGLTQSGLKTIRKGPIATLLHMASIVNYTEVPWKIRIKHAVLFWRFSFWADNCTFRKQCEMLNNKLFLLFYPLGTIFYMRDRIWNK
ncbi:glycosyltransferase family 2 protein [Pseudopedobacter sp.]|uniref:glycosyltransferase family 2 protein n=1 Tax=Pseudopedobacter sp. TaxID=1936787 RepID=UPI0033416272